MCLPNIKTSARLAAMPAAVTALTVREYAGRGGVGSLGGTLFRQMESVLSDIS